MSLASKKGLITKFTNTMQTLITSSTEAMPAETDDEAIIQSAITSRKVYVKKIEEISGRIEKYEEQLRNVFDDLSDDDQLKEEAGMDIYSEKASQSVADAEILKINVEGELMQLECWLENSTKKTLLSQTQQAIGNTSFTLFPQQQSSGINTVQLPKPRLPTFDGNRCSWNAYWNSFHELVDKQASINNTHKFQLLVDSLRGNALDGICEFRVTKNYDNAVEYLKSRYGCEELVTDDLLLQLEKHNSSSSSIGDQRATLVKVKAICSQLLELGESKRNKTLMNIVISKFNRTIREKLYTKREDVEEWNLETMLTTLENIVTIAERVELRVNSGNSFASSPMQHSEDPFIPRRNNFESHTNFQTSRFTPFQSNASQPFSQNTMNATSSSRKFCVYCPSPNHASIDCDVITTPENRRQHLIDNERCLNCGKPNHGVNDCRNPISCSICKNRHHTSICNAKKAYNPSSQDRINSNLTPLGQKKAWSPQKPQQAHAYSVTAKANGNSKLQFGYLLSGQVKLFNEKTRRYENATAAFDSMAETSFIHSSAMKRFGLTSSGAVTLDLHTFGSKKASKATDHAILKIQMMDQARTIHSLTAAQHDTMINAVERPQLSKEDLEFLKTENIEVNEASRVQAKKNVDILIGCDSMWSMIDPAFAIKQLPSGLYAIPTKFGYFITGPHSRKANSKKINVNAVQWSRDEHPADYSTTNDTGTTKQAVTGFSQKSEAIQLRMNRSPEDIVVRQIQEADNEANTILEEIKAATTAIEELNEEQNASMKKAKLAGVRSRMDYYRSRLLVNHQVLKNGVEILQALCHEKSRKTRISPEDVIVKLLGLGRRDLIDLNATDRRIQGTIESINAVKEVLRELAAAEETQAKSAEGNEGNVDQAQKRRSSSHTHASNAKRLKEATHCPACIDELIEIIERKKMKLERIPRRQFAGSHTKPPVDSRNRTIRCLFCQKPHLTDECPEEKDPNARRRTMESRQTCLICLKHSSRIRCDLIEIKQCKYCQSRNHHSALCSQAQDLRTELDKLTAERNQQLNLVAGECCDAHDHNSEHLTNMRIQKDHRVSKRY